MSGSPLGVLTAGLLGMVAPQKWYVRWSALLLWGSSAFWGLKLALKHVDYQVNPSPSTLRRLCRLPELGTAGSVDPWMFYPDGDCSEVTWQFLSFSMPQWLVAIFAAYLLVFVVVAIGNLVKGRCCS
jgi:disulfide bond formation protein DsbB